MGGSYVYTFVIQESDIKLNELVRRCQHHDAVAQRLLYDRYNRLLYAICLRYLGSRDEADDLLVESFVKIYQQIEGLGGDDRAFVAWMKRIVINGAIDIIRYRRYRDHLDVDDSEAMASVRCADDNGIERFMNRELIDRAMQRISDMYRQTLLLIAVDGYSYTEVAEMLQQSVPLVKTHYYRACNQLRKIIRNLDYETWKEYSGE